MMHELSEITPGDYALPDAMLTPDLDNRCAPRARVSIPATLRISGGKGFHTVVRDLSVAGFCASSVNRMANGTRCWLALPGLSPLPAEVVWWNASLVGCALNDLLAPIVLESMIERWRHNRQFYSTS